MHTMVLSEHALEILSLTGDELKHVYRSIIYSLPQSAQTLSGLTRYLGYNRSNAQRILNAINKSDTGLDVIKQMPGTNGLKDFNLCLKTVDVGEQWFSQAERVTAQFESVIKQFAKSHAQLKRALSQTMIWPYYITNKNIWLFSSEDAAMLKIVGKFSSWIECLG